MAISLVQHQLIGPGGIHGVVNIEVASIEILEALSVDSVDVSTIAKVGTGSAATYHILASYNPVIWKELFTTLPDIVNAEDFGIGGYLPVIDQETVDNPATPSGRYRIEVSDLPLGGVGYIDHWTVEDLPVAMQIFHVNATTDVYKRFHDGISWGAWTIAGGSGGSGGFVIEERVTNAFTLAQSDSAKYLRVTDAVGCTITVPHNDTVNISPGIIIHFRQVGTGQLTFLEDGGVTINSAETLLTRKQHSSVSLVKISTNEWDLTGDLELG